MGVYDLFLAYEKWKEHKCFSTFIQLYKASFTDRCKWSAQRRLYTVIRNIITGKYERFYEYYSKDYN